MRSVDPCKIYILILGLSCAAGNRLRERGQVSGVTIPRAESLFVFSQSLLSPMRSRVLLDTQCITCYQPTLFIHVGLACEAKETGQVRDGPPISFAIGVQANKNSYPPPHTRPGVGSGAMPTPSENFFDFFVLIN